MLETYVKKVKAIYQDEAVAESYFDSRFTDAGGRRENEATEAALDRALKSLPGVKKILDMPCGSGRFTRFFDEKGYLYFGADISMEMMRVLVAEERERDKTPPLARCDGEYLPFKDNAFHCVVCIRFLNHRIPDVVMEKILQEMRRVTERWLIIQSANLKSIGPFVRLKAFVRELFGRNVSKYRFRRDLLSLGWTEEGRFWIQGINRYIGVYQKMPRR